MDKQRLQSQLNQQARDLTEARDSLNRQASELTSAKEQVTKLTADLQLFADAMPSDPRGTSPGIRAASFQAQAGQLDRSEERRVGKGGVSTCRSRGWTYQ